MLDVVDPELAALFMALGPLAGRRGLSFDEVYAEVREPIARYALRLLGDADEAADVAQEAAVAIWKGLDRFEGRAAVTTWALGIVGNLARQRLRRKRLEPKAAEPTTLYGAAGGRPDRAAEALDARARLAQLQGALEALSPKQREVFLLVNEGLPYKDVAEQAGVSVANVKVLVHRARKALLDALGGAL